MYVYGYQFKLVHKLYILNNSWQPPVCQCFVFCESLFAFMQISFESYILFLSFIKIKFKKICEALCDLNTIKKRIFVTFFVLSFRCDLDYSLTDIFFDILRGLRTAYTYTFENINFMLDLNVTNNCLLGVVYVHTFIFFILVDPTISFVFTQK